ncbi:hypothetical protein LPN04_29705 [Rugamonas sp. A1-17]|nr:hypothetical protein [Rugamonas sp. A1-17]
MAKYNTCIESRIVQVEVGQHWQSADGSLAIQKLNIRMRDKRPWVCEVVFTRAPEGIGLKRELRIHNFSTAGKYVRT